MTTPVTYFRQTWDELKQVVWPTRKEIARLTVIVILISLIIGVYLGGIDYIFNQAVEALLRK